MTKQKRLMIIGAIVVIIAIVLLLAVGGGLFTYYDDTVNGEFSIAEERYQKIIGSGEFSVEALRNTFSELNEYVGPVADAAIARKKAEKIWLNVFSKETGIKDEKPYQVYYDSENAVWLVRGTLPEGYIGGTAHILLEKDSGKIIAVWHEK